MEAPEPKLLTVASRGHARKRLRRILLNSVTALLLLLCILMALFWVRSYSVVDDITPFEHDALQIVLRKD